MYARGEVSTKLIDRSREGSEREVEDEKWMEREFSNE